MQQVLADVVGSIVPDQTPFLYFNMTFHALIYGIKSPGRSSNAPKTRSAVIH
jgi:hypothetical protein